MDLTFRKNKKGRKKGTTLRGVFGLYDSLGLWREREGFVSYRRWNVLAVYVKKSRTGGCIIGTTHISWLDRTIDLEASFAVLCVVQRRVIHLPPHLKSPAGTCHFILHLFQSPLNPLTRGFFFFFFVSFYLFSSPPLMKVFVFFSIRFFWGIGKIG